MRPAELKCSYLVVAVLRRLNMQIVNAILCSTWNDIVAQYTLDHQEAEGNVA